ncbi:MAG: lysine--tRNA ligase [archaeon]
MTRVQIASEIFDSFPDLAVGVLIIGGINNRGAAEIDPLLTKEEQKIRSHLNISELGTNQFVRPWREAYSLFGAKPKKYKCSVEALLRRILSGESLPKINLLVDTYNYVSIKHLLPIGADDLSMAEGDIRLTIAEGTESFTPIGSEPEKPRPGEVVYADDKDILCRRWNWRESDKTKITPDTASALIYIESLTGKDALNSAIDDLKRLLHNSCASINSFILVKSAPTLNLITQALETTRYHAGRSLERRVEEPKGRPRIMERGSVRKSDDSLHWADQIAQQLKERASEEPILKKIVKEKGYIVYDEKTPSGKIHIGAGRGWIIHDVIAKAIRDNGMNGRFILSSDDIDPFDKMNNDLPASYKKYLGMPFRDMPSPVKGYKSFADYYFMTCVEKFDQFGIEAEIQSTGTAYDKGLFNKAIKTALDNADKIQAIYRRFYGDTIGANKLPFNPVCEKCGKIGTTLATEWDPESETLKYECKQDLVSWAKGCGHSGQISPYNGNGKFPWKVEWAAKWPTIGVSCELAGKDHFTHGGSRTIAVAISDEIFDFPPPYPSTRKATGKGYEFFTIGGKKMSTSKGRGIGFVDMTQYAPAKILRYLLVRTRPHAMIDFDPYGTNDLILLHDRYDKTERIISGAEEADARETQQQKRIYKLAHVGPKTRPCPVSFTHAATTMQVALSESKAIDLLKQSGHIRQNINKTDLANISERLEFAMKWVQEFAPEQYRFSVNEKTPAVRIGPGEKESLKLLSKALKKEMDENELYEKFYSICKDTETDPTQFFRSAYQVLISKDRGPKLAPFIFTIGRSKVRSLLDGLK